MNVIDCLSIILLNTNAKKGKITNMKSMQFLHIY